jgi:hypothetical protein
MIQSAVGALVVREGALSGSFPNPGTIGRRKDKAQTTGAEGPSPPAQAAVSPPIKPDLIGAANDGQLKAALSYLDGEPRPRN